MNSEDLSLCCCEYFDRNHQRNHILACCCNCEDLDEGFEGLVSGRGVPTTRRSAIMATIRDRLRIPWRGGAKQVAPDSILPVMLIPLTLIHSSLSFWRTIISFMALLIFLFFFSCHLTQAVPKTKFFFAWTLTSLLVLYTIFEFIVIPFLQILVEENIFLSLLIIGFVTCLYLTRSRNRELETVGIECGVNVGPRTHNCSICRVSVPDRDHHCAWYDCCIGSHNQHYFILSLIFAEAALLYSSNLTLTSVCHPYIFFKTILLPDDCSEVYEQIELGLSFVSAIYSLGLALVILLLILHQVLLVSLGMTGHEWRSLTLSQKCCLGLSTSRPYSKGFCRNWSRIVCRSQKQYSLVNQ